MTIHDILEQAKTLTPQERQELIDELVAMQDEVPVKGKQPKTGAEIAAAIRAMEKPIEFVDPHIEDPVEWVKAQRKKQADRLKPYWDGEK